MKGMGIRQYPELRDMNFGYYIRVLYIAQTECGKLQAKVVQAAAELGPTYEYRYASYGELAGFIRGLPHQRDGLRAQKTSH
jgi:hypothetical protein